MRCVRVRSQRTPAWLHARLAACAVASASRAPAPSCTDEDPSDGTVTREIVPLQDVAEQVASPQSGFNRCGRRL